MSGRREDLRIGFASIDGVQLGTFDKVTGGDLDSEESKYTAAGGEEEPLGGRKTTDNVVVARNFKVGRDDLLIQQFAHRRGQATMVVTDQPTDADYNPFGRPLTYTGVLKRISKPDTDSESNDAAMLEVELSAGATVSA